MFLQGAAQAQDIKGAALVDAQNPERGSIPDMIYGYGIAAPSSGGTLTASFQRDGRISDIKVQVDDVTPSLGQYLPIQMDFGPDGFPVRVSYAQPGVGLCGGISGCVGDADISAAVQSLLSNSRRIRIAHIPRQGITSMNGIHVTNRFSANA
jgi:hypothetical protein